MNEKEIREQIENYITLLVSTDYRVLKYIEGYYTEQEYQQYKQERQYYRQKINELEELLENQKKVGV